MIDSDGYRPNVGIILINHIKQVLWCRRLGQDAWQFPQGGIRAQETPEQAMYRELYEEAGLLPEHVRLIGVTRRWLKYDLPEHLIRRDAAPLCIGQKQRWFLLHLAGDDGRISLNQVDRPEFDAWRWVSYWYPMCHVIEFKRNVYRQALTELALLLPKQSQAGESHA